VEHFSGTTCQNHLDYRHLLRRLKVVWNLNILDEATPTRQPGRTVLSSLPFYSLYFYTV
jgi:hypothetical protein